MIEDATKNFHESYEDTRRYGVQITLPCKIGDYIGYISRCEKDGVKFWRLSEAKVTSIRYNKNGVQIYAPKRFHPLDADEVVFNTKLMRGGSGLIVTQEPFVLDEETRNKVEQWIEWANENPDQVKGILQE